MTRKFQIKRTISMLHMNRRRVRESTRLLPFFIYMFWASNGIGATYRAFVHGHYNMVALLFFVYFVFLPLEYWVSLFHRFPQHNKSIRKGFFKNAICFLFTATMLAIAYQFALSFGMPTSLFLYAISIACSALIFYFYIIFDDQIGCNICCSSDGETKFSHCSCHVDMKFKHSDSILDKV